TQFEQTARRPKSERTTGRENTIDPMTRQKKQRASSGNAVGSAQSLEILRRRNLQKTTGDRDVLRQPPTAWRANDVCARRDGDRPGGLRKDSHTRSETSERKYEGPNVHHCNWVRFSLKRQEKSPNLHKTQASPQPVDI